MSRRTGALKRREIIPDHKYGDLMVSRFINYMMKDGKKSISENIFYDAMDLIKNKTGNEGIEIFREAVENVTPQVEVRSRRVGGATYQVPVEIRPERMKTLTVRWIITYARQRKEHTMAQKLAGELMDAHKNLGGSIKKRDETKKMAEANRAFSHYKW